MICVHHRFSRITIVWMYTEIEPKTNCFVEKQNYRRTTSRENIRAYNSDTKITILRFWKPDHRIINNNDTMVITFFKPRHKKYFLYVRENRKYARKS